MILLAGTPTYALAQLETLREAHGPVLVLDCKDRQDFFAKLSGEYRDVRAIYRHNDSRAKIGVFDRELISHLPESCKYICHNGAGYDQIDVHAAKERGLLYCN